MATATVQVLNVGTVQLRPRESEERLRDEVEGSVLPAATPVIQPSGREVPVVFVTGHGQPRPMPKDVKFGGLHDPLLRLLKPIQLSVSTEERYVVVNWPDVDEFGSGDTLTAALDDFSVSLGQLYHHLHAKREYGPDLLRVRQVLDEYIAQRPR